MMRRSVLAVVFAGILAPPSVGAAQSEESPVVLMVDPGPTRLNVNRLQRAIGEALQRTVIRMTDARAQTASGRLSIAFSAPDRWVLRYEAGGQVAWVSDRVRGARRLRSRLTELSRNVVSRVENSSEARRRRAWDQAWDDALIIALQNEIVDPFEGERPEQDGREPVTLLWSEVIDPFVDRPSRAELGQVWTEVLDPWDGELRR